MDVTSTSTSTSTAAGAKGATRAAAPSVSGDFQMFLKMLTAQMKNQDPLNPIQSSDYAVQLATFSGVEQQVKTNELLGSLMGNLGASGMGQLAAWVGMEARTTAAVPFSGQPIALYPSPAAEADRTVLVAYDQQGREVTRQEIPVSADPVNWTGATGTGGSVLHGTYVFRLESYAAGRLLESQGVEAFARIAEVRQGTDGAILALEGGATVAAADVRALRPYSGG